MGLDMFLSLRKEEYVSDYSDGKEVVYPKELAEFEKEIIKKSFRFVSKQTSYNIGYWRKANAIHNWFVEECADGVDECQDIVVERKQAERLLDLCNQVLIDHSLAEELLPCKSGFFFGSTEYNEWYFMDIEYTRKTLKMAVKFLAQNDDYKLVYNASW